MERFVNYERGDVVVFEFPFSDSNIAKKRPSLVVAKLVGDSIILCSITSQPRPDSDIIELKTKDFQSGGINKDSFIRPSTLFTVHKSRIEYKAGHINKEKIKQVQSKLCEMFTR